MTAMQKHPQRLSAALVFLASALSLGACTTGTPSGDIPIPPPQAKGETLQILPQEVGIPSAQDRPSPPPAPDPVSAPPNYFGPNGVGTGTTSGPSPNRPFVDSVASCAAILDPEARQLCLQRAGTR